MSTSDIAAPRTRLANLVAQVVWEAILLVLVVAMIVVIMVQGEIDLGRWLWPQLSVLGLLATGFALSVRTATPNLAVGAMAGLSGAIYAKLCEAMPGIVAALVGLAVVTVVGLILALLIAVTKVPAWAVSLVAIAAMPAIGLAIVGHRGIAIPVDRPGPAQGIAWTAVFVLGSLIGGALFLMPAVRRSLGGSNTGAETAGLSARLLRATVGFGGSSLLAAASGILFGYLMGFFQPAGAFGNLLFAVGAAFLGAVSVFGGRGGVAGVVLATTLLVLIRGELLYLQSPNWVSHALVPAAAIFIGLSLSWVSEKLAGPKPLQLTATKPT